MSMSYWRNVWCSWCCQSINGEEDSVKTFNEYNDALYDSAWKSQFLSGLMQPLSNFVGNLGYVSVCLLGGFLAGG